MKSSFNNGGILNAIKRLCAILLFMTAAVSISYAGNLFIDPASPLVEAGGSITLSVTNANGDVRWTSFYGNIQGSGSSVIYSAPDKVTIDSVMALDDAGNSGMVRVLVMREEEIDDIFSRKNANLEIFTNRGDIQAILLSDDGSTMWVGTNGGLEERDPCSGRVKRIYTNQSGLPDNLVLSLQSDSHNGIWAGTWGGGLAHLKPDGSIEILDKDNSGLPDNDVEFLLPDSQGGIWVATYSGGLAHLKEDSTWQVFNTDNSGLPSNYVNCILSDGQEGIWVGTYYSGLGHLKKDGTWQIFNTENSGLPNIDVLSLLSDGEGGLWIGTYGGGLAHLRSDDTWQVFNEENCGLPSNSVSTILSDGQGGILVGTWGGGIGHLKLDGTWEVLNKNNSALPSDSINFLLSDTYGGIWVGTYFGGLAYLNTDGTWDIPDEDGASLPSNYINTLLLDGSGGVWIGTRDGGVGHLRLDATWEVFNQNNSGLPGNSVYSLLLDGQGGIWLGTWGYGLEHLKPDGTWDVFDEENSDLPSNYVDALLSDGQGGIWAGTYSKGIGHLKTDGNWEVFDSNSHALLNNYVNCFVSDAHGGIWVGTTNGLGLLHPDGSWKIFDQTSSDLPDNYILSLFPDGQDGLWVGTGQGGLGHLKPDYTWEIFDENGSGLPDNRVYAILSDGRNGLWLGTGQNTISHLKSDRSWEVFDMYNSDRIIKFLSDGHGGIWAGTVSSGLEHLKSDGTWEVFNQYNSELPEDWVNAIIQDGQGGIWAATQDYGAGCGGLAHITFSASQIQDEQYLNGGRAAIIIAGGGNTDDNLLWDSTAKISNYIYKMLNKRGFLNTDIHYISPQPFADFNGDGLDDKIVDTPNPARQLQVSDIQAAFDWAKTKGELNQPLYIFFTDHGGIDKLQLAQGVYIEASELKSMVDDYQTTTGNKVIFVIDACHSGSMVKALAGENRCIISSTDTGLAYFDRTEDQSFIYFVTKGLFKGMNFVEAFHYATSKQKELLGKLTEYSKVSGGEAGSFSQEPQYDDTGDGLYSISDEGNWLKTISVNGTFTNADITLAVEAVTQSGVISGLNPVPLKAKATLAAGNVRRVWSVIRPPQMDILVDNTGVPLLAFPKIDLSALKSGENTDTEDQNIYEGSWNGFIYNGEYEVTFYAQDNEGNIESSKSITLTVDDGMECPQKASVTMKPDKALYKPGDSLTISATEHLAYGYDLYMILFLPDGRFTALQSPVKDSNGLQQNSNKFYLGDRWMNMHRNMGKPVTIIDMMLPQEKLLAGQYCLYAVLIPEGEDLVTAAGKGLFVLDGVSFEIVGE